MAGKRKIHGAAFKAQVALAAHKGDRTINELAGHYGVHPTLIHGWKKQLLTGAEGVFGSPAQAASADAEARQAELFEQIGRLKMELEWLKKTRLANLGREARICPNVSQKPAGFQGGTGIVTVASPMSRPKFASVEKNNLAPATRAIRPE